jgi:glycosyltransferase involved in cell wall biosynthesis
MRKVLVNGLQISSFNTGVQYYTHNLFKEFKKIEKDSISIDIVQNLPPTRLSLKFPRINRIFYENYFLPKFLLHNKYSIYHSPNYVLPYYINTPSVITIHDLITFDYPELCQKESVLYFKLLLKHSVKKATKIIAVSETVKNDILKHFDVSPSKIEVIYHGIGPIFKRTIDETILYKYHLPKKYILFVGNIEPKKNLERLVRAFDLMKRTKKLKHKLVIVGKKGWNYKSVFRIIDELYISGEVIFTGYVPEEDLPTIYSIADIFVFPSLYEGFGFPPLESMACEVPVLISDKGALPEITGGICLQIDPYCIDEIAEGMYRLLTNIKLRERSIQQGKEWVKQFSWEKAAMETYMIYKQAIKNNETDI